MTTKMNFTILKNGISQPLADIPTLTWEDFKQSILEAVAKGIRVSALFACNPSETSQTEDTILYVILANDIDHTLYALRTLIIGDSFSSMTQECPQVDLFEREIAEQFGLVPKGHPWLKPVRYHASWTHRDAWKRSKSTQIIPGSGPFFQIAGEQVHEVAVGPVHAGIIEPGHFRFQCQGEGVLHLEIALGYQHRGIEKAMIDGPHKKSLHYMETLSGDATIGHTLSYCQAIESLSETEVPKRALYLRGIMLELERIANHVGDLGALANDVGFLPTSSFCGRIRGDWLNLTALICGNRFGRNMIIPGGVAYDINQHQIATLKEKIDGLEKETSDAINLLWKNQSVLLRFKETGIVPKQTVIDLGLVGPVSRASGLARDARIDFPSGIFEFSSIPVSTLDSCDVYARAYVRWLEIMQSITFIKRMIENLPQGPIKHLGDKHLEDKYLSEKHLDEKHLIEKLLPNHLTVTINEGWRGEICHVAITNATGNFSRYKIIDPSFHNWMGLAIALRNQAISDFPICNKSFNLSYCGHDL